MHLYPYVCLHKNPCSKWDLALKIISSNLQREVVPWSRTYLGLHSFVQTSRRGINTNTSIWVCKSLLVSVAYRVIFFFAPFWTLFVAMTKHLSKSTWSQNVDLWSQRFCSVVCWLHCSGTEAPQNVIDQEMEKVESRKGMEKGSRDKIYSSRHASSNRRHFLSSDPTS